MTEAVAPFAATLLEASRRAWSANCAWRLGETRPELSSVVGLSGSEDWRAHFDGLLQHLSVALEFGAPELFVQQVAWLRISFDARGVEPGVLAGTLLCLRDELRERLPERAAACVTDLIDVAAMEIARPAADAPTALVGEDSHSVSAREYLFAALDGRREDAISVLTRALESGMTASVVTSDVLGRVQAELGALWQRAELSIVEEHLVSRTTEEALARIHARAPRATPNGRRVLILGVAGDLHDLGLRVVAAHFEAAGWTPIFLGASVPPAEAASAAAEFDVHLVTVGATLVTQIRSAAEFIALLRKDPSTRATPVIFGGRPFQVAPELWRTLGANGAAANAPAAVALGERLVARS